jgi:hypothetical protein
MRQLDRADAPSVEELLALGLPPLLVTLALWWTTPNEVLPDQVVAAFIATSLPWWSYRGWKRLSDAAFPLFGLISAAYWVYFIIPLFWEERTPIGLARVYAEITNTSVSQVMLLLLLGLGSLWLGMQAGLGRRLIQVRLPDLPADAARWNYLRTVLVLFAPLSLIPGFVWSLGAGGRNLLIIATDIVPIVVFALLFRNFLRGGASKLDLYLILFFCAVQMLKGLSTIWLGSAILPFLVIGLIYVDERKRFPLFPVLGVIAMALFLQVGKDSARSMFWRGPSDTGLFERAGTWVEQSSAQWSSALDDPTGTIARELAGLSQTRVSLLNNAVSVVELTPAVIPHQGSHLYSYMLVTFVPRFVWPDKPTVNEANQFYQVTYGLTETRLLDKVSIAVGVLIEAYIAFGWVGVFLVMLALGVFLEVFRALFLGQNVGLLARSIGFSLLPQMLTVEAQLAQYIGGLVQQIVVALLILAPAFWALRRQDARSAARSTDHLHRARERSPMPGPYGA